MMIDSDRPADVPRPTKPVPPVVTPPPGRAMLACRCGRMLGLTDMYRPLRTRPRSPGSLPLIEPICCERCAEISPL